MRIEIDDVRFAHGSSEILKGISVQIPDRASLAIIGPNGSGKTTLLKILAGISRDYSGVVRFGSTEHRSLTEKALARTVGYVPQSYNSEFSHSVEDFVRMGLYSSFPRWGSFPRGHSAAVAQVLALTDTAGLAARPMRSLSGGEKQRVMIAAALVHRPQVLLLDEPTTFLDPKHEARVEGLLIRIQDELNLSVISVTHNLNLAALNADLVLALKEGCRLAFGTPAEVVTPDTLSRVFDHQFDCVEHLESGRVMVLPVAARRTGATFGTQYACACNTTGGA